MRIGGVALSSNCTANNSANCTIASRVYQIAEVRVHPSYDQPKYANDIALVKIIGEASGEFIIVIILYDPLSITFLFFLFQHTYIHLSADYTPICLPPNLSVSVRDQLIGSPGIALGWTADVEGKCFSFI